MAPRPRFAKLDADKQQRILEVALNEFVERGFEDASLNRIIEAAGISKGAMYYYFDDKADLFSTVFIKVMNDLMERFDPHPEELDETTFWPYLSHLMHEGTELMQRDPRLVALGRVYYSLTAEMRERGPLAENLKEMLNWPRRLIIHGQKLGLVRRDLPVEVLLELLVAVDQVLDRWRFSLYEESTTHERQRQGELCLQIQRRLLEPPPHQT